MTRFLSVLTLFFIFAFFGCRRDKAYPNYNTENVIIIVVDGARYSETWGEPSHSFIPNQSALRHEGVLFTNFYNDGETLTIAGHTALTTGSYQWINNDGQQLPNHQSIFQEYRKQHSIDQTKTWVISSKDKLQVLSNTESNSWSNKYMPSTNCGVNGAGVGSGYREDSITMMRFFEIFDEHHPNLVLLNFRDPDFTAHQGDWNGYLEGISKTDEYIQQIWDYIQNDPLYSDNTTLFITNDHGRHLNGVSSGFAHHGDNCDGCKHISLLVIGPDFPKNVVNSDHYNQTDVSATVAELLHFPLNKGNGHMIAPLFNW